MNGMPAAASGQWIAICALDELPRQGARACALPDGDIALFRTVDDRVFALRDRCPHRGGPLSQELVVGAAVTCPLHGWTLDFASGRAHAPDHGCAVRYAVRVVDGTVWLRSGVTPGGGADD